MLNSAIPVKYSGIEAHNEKKSDFAYRKIRQMIVDFALLPGVFIDKTEICKSLRVSRQPVTMALTRLAREGLVEILPQRGSYVTRLSLSTILEAVAIQSALEAFAARHLAKAGASDQLAELRGLVEGQAHALETGAGDAFKDLNQDFHRRLAASAGLAKLTEQVEIGLAAVARCIHVLDRDTGFQTHTVQTHGRILDAIEAGDGMRAADLISGDIDAFRRTLEAEAQRRPEIFID